MKLFPSANLRTLLPRYLSIYIPSLVNKSKLDLPLPHDLSPVTGHVLSVLSIYPEIQLLPGSSI